MIALALLMAPVAVADAVAPPLDVTIRQASEQIRDDGHGARRFRIARTIVFAAEPTGYRVTVTLTSADADSNPAERQRYRAANATMLDRPIVMHVDQAGRLTAIDDFEAVSRAWIAGLTTTAPAGQDPKADALRARLDALSPTRRREMIGSVVTSLFAGASERVPSASRPVKLASPAPFSDIVMTGTTATFAEGTRMRTHLSATGRAASTATRPAASLAVTTDRLVDPASGLIVSSTRRETTAGPGLKLSITATTKLSW